MFTFSNRSINNLTGVHSDLVHVVQRAIEVTTIDFGITEGRRSIERQQELIDAGKSWTLKGRHLPTIDGEYDFINGVSHAIDALAYVGGHASWDMADYAEIAIAMRKAADDLGSIKITWGAVWDRTLNQLSLEDGSFNDDIDLYVARFVDAKGRRPRLDGPHFQLAWEQYPG